MSDAFVPLEAVSTASDGGSRFTGRLRSSSFGAMQLSEVTGRQVSVHRTRATIKRSDPGLLKVGLQLAGRGVVVQHDREAVLTPGDFTIYDTSTPYDLHFDDDFDMFVLMFPREMLTLAPREVDTVSARRISGRSGFGALVSQLLASLHQNVINGTVPVTPLVEGAVANLLTAALGAEVPDVGCMPGGALLIAIKSFVEEHLGDPALDTSLVASQHHISPRYLQKLFEAEGHTVAAWIRDRRLACCRRDLVDPRSRENSIGAICMSYGLVNYSNFSRLFRERYGMSPRAYRAAHSGASALAPALVG
ncbi:helix-turn-helix domain-containing protein [Rhodococcus opacus]|uniref:AraC-like ligand-binding domain-containing protein n=1 Tax=Rhodococcus opacus TaxID=37919 RepID=UPI001FF53FF6|nr:helix-turn-helix domain-containing protein [Rhodococcus opacus]UOT07745.1 helix-turn-helix domain-containing protein [Rhodococcus opacus]